MRGAATYVEDNDGDWLNVSTNGEAVCVRQGRYADSIGELWVRYTPQQALDLAKALIAAVKEVTGE